MATRISELLHSRSRYAEELSPAALFVGEPAALGITDLAGLAKAPNVEEALARLTWEVIPVVLCDCAACDGEWRTTIRLLSHAPCRPSVVLVAAGELLQHWEEVAEAGGYDVLRKPSTPEALDRIIRSAASYWRSRRALESAQRW